MGLFNKIFGSKYPAPPCAIHPGDKALVRDEDVAWWNGLSLDDCKASELQDNITKTAGIAYYMEEEGLSEEDAAKKARRDFLYYYWTLEQRKDEHFPLLAADAKLPYVLKDRINKAVTRGKIDREALTRTSSFNALVRDLIQSGTI